MHSILSEEDRRLHRNAYQAAWKKANRESVNATNQRVKAARPDHYREINRRSVAKKRASWVNGENADIQLHWREKNSARYLLTHARGRAKRKGLAFDLTEEDVVVPEFCPVLGIRLEWGVGRRASRNHASPSLDRLDPGKGYVKGNVYVISNRANHLKNNGTARELRLIADYIERKGGS